MTRSALTVIIAGVLGCAGPAARTQPLLIARPAAATVASPEITVEMNSLLLRLPAGAVTGCFDLAGAYVRNGNDVTVTLRQVPREAGCASEPGPFVTRIGPFSPGRYRVRVTLEGKEVVSSGSAKIG